MAFLALFSYGWTIQQGLHNVGCSESKRRSRASAITGHPQAGLRNVTVGHQRQVKNLADPCSTWHHIDEGEEPGQACRPAIKKTARGIELLFRDAFQENGERCCTTRERQAPASSWLVQALSPAVRTTAVPGTLSCTHAWRPCLAAPTPTVRNGLIKSGNFPARPRTRRRFNVLQFPTEETHTVA